MKIVAMIAVGVLLTGCGGDGADRGGEASRNELAASACDAFVRNQLADKSYQLDSSALAASLTDTGNGASFLKAPITIDPGLSSESQQVLECTVRFAEAGKPPDVLKMQFIW